MQDASDVEEDYEETVTGYNGLLSGSNIKILLAVFVIFLFINSDAFIDKALSRISGAVNYKIPTSKGVVVQATLMVLGVIAAEMITQFL